MIAIWSTEAFARGTEMAYREVERPNGIGILKKSDGTAIGERRYDLVVYQQMHDAGHGEQIPGMKQIEGRIHLEEGEGFDFVIHNAELILELKDGRSLPFFFTNNNGKIAARGALK